MGGDLCPSPDGAGGRRRGKVSGLTRQAHNGEPPCAAADTKMQPPAGPAEPADTGGAQSSSPTAPTLVRGGPTQVQLEQLAAQDELAREVLQGLRQQAQTPTHEVWLCDEGNGAGRPAEF